MMMHSSHIVHHLSKLCLYVLAIIGTISFINLNVNTVNNNDNTVTRIVNMITTPKVKDLIRVSKCLIEQGEKITDNRFWYDFPGLLDNTCKLGVDLGFSDFKNKDEVKRMILPKSHTYPAKIYTFGIGNDIWAETAMQKTLPNAHFMGLDPISASGSPYADIGWYLQLGIGAESKIINGSVLKGGKYQWQMIRVVGLYDFVKEFNIDKMDLVLLDVEGPEYSILPILTREHNEVTICQLNVELHGPLQDYGYNFSSYKKIIMDHLRNSPYALVEMSKPINHIRAVYLNIESPYCIQNYLS